MRVFLGSADEQIKGTCQETVADLLPSGWTLHITTGNIPVYKAADLYVWDVESGNPVLPEVDPKDSWRHIYLVNREEVQHFRELISSADARIVLKPVTRSALAAFVSEACDRLAGMGAEEDTATVSSVSADRDAILQCLLQTNLKLQEYDQDRTNFLARAIHDFRAPLTAVTGYCGLLLGDDLGPLTDEQREVLERIQRSAKKLSRMTNSMFQLSIAPRLEVAAALQAGEIRDCIDQALHEIEPVADEKQVSIAVDVTASPRPLHFEHMKIEQVILNLLDNACKFTPRGGAIGIHGYPCYWDRTAGLDQMSRGNAQEDGFVPHHAPNAYRVDVRDSGPGIPPVHLGKIFEEYTSYGGGVDRSGGGLGLAICRMILSQHHGRIWAESTSHGATFSFVLPFEANGADCNARNGVTRVSRAVVSV